MLDRIDMACHSWIQNSLLLHCSASQIPAPAPFSPPPRKFVLAILKAGRFFGFSGGSTRPFDIQNDSTRPSLLKAEMLRTNRWSFFNEKWYTRIRHLASSTNPRNPCKLVQYPTTNHPLDEMGLLWSPTNIRSWEQAYIIFKAPTCKTCEKTVVSFPPHVACDLGNLNERPGSKIFRKKKKHFQNTQITSQKKKNWLFRLYRGLPAYVGGFWKVKMMKFQDKSQWSREGSKVVVHFHPREGIWRIFFFSRSPRVAPCSSNKSCM